MGMNAVRTLGAFMVPASPLFSHEQMNDPFLEVPPLPANWAEATDATTGRKYYYDINTQVALGHGTLTWLQLSVSKHAECYFA